MEEKKIVLKDADLVINTMIDALQYENRRVIDYHDVNSYEEKCRWYMQQNHLNVIFYGDRTTQESFVREIDGYLVVYDDKYVVLPWISQEDLIKGFRGSVPFDFIKVIARVDRKSFLSPRSKDELDNFTKINDIVVADYLETVTDNVRRLEIKLTHENKKLEKIKEYKRG